MNRIFPLLTALLAAGTLQAQSYHFDRNTGEVTVGGKTAFYLARTNGTLGYAVRNAAGQDLIRVSNGEMDKEGRGDVAGYKFTFAASGNYCSFLPSSVGFNTQKSIINTVFRHSLVAADTVTASSERAFVLSNRGHYERPAPPQVLVNIHTPEPTPQTPPPATAATSPTASANGIAVHDSVWFDGEKAYAGNRLVGNFHRETDIHGLYVIYGPDDLFVAKAGCYPGCAEWNIETKDEKTFRLRNYPDRSLERVFEFLLKFHYLK
ncbi:MAG: hypothetical protein EOO16_25415 [Chitinophagaceae bacterium]|nr:MAG: hypothetical protein EOO16_25415 [Chitinophagaceae bacterium]